LDVLSAMAERKNAGDNLQQLVVQLFLERCEIDCQCLWLSRREFTNVPAAGPVDEGAEGVQSFNRASQFDPCSVIQRRLLEAIISLLESWCFPEKQLSPLGLSGFIHISVCFVFPAFRSQTALVDGGIDKTVRLGHLLEA